MRPVSTPAQKALWFIESHFAENITLDDVAACAGVSRFHLARAFESSMGCSAIRYMRERRLTEAARRLAKGAPDILNLALEMGYGPHEAFTRAFRDQFGVTPEQVRTRGTVDDLKLKEPIKMTENTVLPQTRTRLETSQARLIADLSQRYTCENSAVIPSQRQRFLHNCGHVPGQVGRIAYGVSYNQAERGNFDYLCGIEVKDFAKLPTEFDRVRVPEHKYLVFTHEGHISGIRATWNSIWNQWLPQSGLQLADGPFLERYDETFDPQTGFGGVEIWIPVKE